MQYLFVSVRLDLMGEYIRCLLHFVSWHIRQEFSVFFMKKIVKIALVKPMTGLESRDLGAIIVQQGYR